MAVKQNLKLVNLADNEEVAKKFQISASSNYERNKSLTEQFMDMWKVDDYMHKCAQNRTLNSSEKSQGADDPKDNRANLGSTLFHRQVNQMASQLVSVELSRPMPFKYEPIYVSGVYNSMDEGQAEADQMNTLAKYTMKRDKYKKKATDLAFSLTKYGNIPMMMEWKFEVKTVKIPEPTYETEIDEQTGEEIVTQTGTKVTEREVVIAAHPSQRTINISQLVADPYIGDMQEQTTVVVMSLAHKSELLNGVNKGLYSQKAYDSLTETDMWDGDSGSDFKKEMMTNIQKEWEENSVSDLYMKWDIFHRAPIDGKNWDDENLPVWYFATVIGNDVSAGKVFSLIRNPDPDDEVPITMINLYPDDSDLLYHVSPGEIVRSNYSTECTLKELAIDNMAKVNRPNIKAVIGQHRVKDFSGGSGNVWNVYDKDAITEDVPRDNTQSTIGMLEYIKQDSRTALGTGKNQLGESYGARTTQYEAQTINQQTSQPDLVWISYVLDQKLTFWARKNASFWKTYGSPVIIQKITDMPLIPDVYPTDFKGEFDIEVNIVGEYQDDLKSSATLTDMIRMVAQSPQLLQSATHQVDIGGMMKEVFFKSGLNGDRFIKTPQDGDAGRMAEMENIAMMRNGEQVVVNEDDNDAIHIRKHEGEKLKWIGMEEQNPNLEYLNAHIQEHKLREQNAGQQGLNAQQQQISGVIQ